MLRPASEVYRRLCPKQFAVQKSFIDRTPKEWVISGTVFTTITVNRNFRTAVHKDKGDLPDGFGIMTVLRRGYYSGGHLVFPKYRVAVDMGDRDLLLADVHEWHGNTPIQFHTSDAERISVVMYYRAGMIECFDPDGELARVRSL
jgi:hypothetical protein